MAQRKKNKKNKGDLPPPDIVTKNDFMFVVKKEDTVILQKSL